MENLKAFFDLTKLPTKFFLLFAVVSGFILFANKEILDSLQLSESKEKYGWIVGLTFTLSSGLVVVKTIIWTYKYIYGEINFVRYKKGFREKVNNLDLHEKAVIREFIINQQSSINMPINDPVITGLLEKRILKINKQFGNSTFIYSNSMSVSLTNYAEKIIVAKDLDLSENPTKEEIEFIKNNRPQWINRW